ncbi:MAG TPA: serine/threonine-protein kinase [Thermoanaerobaculia bacterium]|nr:serine/threonine-protein kinase [Thermoanaerobaculia bacterium]
MSTLDGGQTVGRYRIERFLGAGAMGEVYLAQDPHIERPLAIKTVRLVGRPQEIDDRKKRLLREAKAAGRLLHPNIVTLFDAGEAEDVLYLAFEFVEGSDLSTRVGTVPLSLREVLGIIEQSAEALDYAHRQGIVHRDIKPSNILLDRAGRVKVADFGIAKMAGQSTELTMAGSVMGSPQYLSPEQIRGEELDGRSDIFSLGVVLFELLSGKRPFDGDTITTLVYQILHKEPPPVSELRGGIPPRLEKLLYRMLAKDREERLSTAGLVAEEIRAIERELPDETLSALASTGLAQQVPTHILPRRTTAAAPMPEALGKPASGPHVVPPPVAAASPIPPAVASATAGPGAPIPPPAAAAASSKKGLWIALGVFFVGFIALAGVGGTLAWRYVAPMLPPSLGGSKPADAQTPAPPATPTPTEGNPASTAANPPTAPAPSAPATSAAPSPGAASSTSNGSTAPSASVPPTPPVVLGQPIEIRHQPPRSLPAAERANQTAAASPSPPPAPAVQEPARRQPPAPAPPAGRPVTAPPPAVTRAPESAPAEAPEEPREREPEANQHLKTGLNLAFRVTPPDAFILVDRTVIGRAEEWSGLKGSRPYTFAEAGEHTIKIKKPGMRDYRIAVEASETSGTTQVTAHLQPLPAAEVSTPDLQAYRVRQGIGLQVAPETATVTVDGRLMGLARRFNGGRFRRGDWLDLSPGTHRVTIAAPGYERRDLAVEVTDGADRDRQRIEINLSPGGGG